MLYSRPISALPKHNKLLDRLCYATAEKSLMFTQFSVSPLGNFLIKFWCKFCAANFEARIPPCPSKTAKYETRVLEEWIKNQLHSLSNDHTSSLKLVLFNSETGAPYLAHSTSNYNCLRVLELHIGITTSNNEHPDRASHTVEIPGTMTCNGRKGSNV